MLSEVRIQIENNNEKYARKMAATRQKKIDDEDLMEIARMMLKDVSQVEMAKQLGVHQSTISRRINTIETEFPELLHACSLDTEHLRDGEY